MENYSFVLAMILFAGCINGESQQSKNNGKLTDTTINQVSRDIPEERNEEFRKWMTDTLKVLKPSDGVVEMAPDTLGFSLIKEQKYEVQGLNWKSTDLNPDLAVLLETLEEYNELPNHEFVITFKTNYFYSPSPIQQLVHSTIFEYEEITVIDGNKTISYDYIRGRLSGKSTISKGKDGKIVKTDEQFVWIDGKLIKRK